MHAEFVLHIVRVGPIIVFFFIICLSLQSQIYDVVMAIKLVGEKVDFYIFPPLSALS